MANGNVLAQITYTPLLQMHQRSPDAAGNFPSGFSKNVNNNCIPDKCPKGFVKHDNDESGVCYTKKIKGKLGKVSDALNNLISGQ